MRLVYFADPLCSWCYGFGPELARLLERRPQARLELVMGGLRPFNREPMSAPFRQMLREHWGHVAEASGLAFSQALLERAGFVYDTEPACRAVVAARGLDEAGAFPYMKAVQAAFYRDGRDMTRPEDLAQVAAEHGHDAENFLARMQSDALREETRADFARAQATGVSGFPTLALAHGGELYLVTAGFVTAAVLEERVARIELLVAKKE